MIVMGWRGKCNCTGKGKTKTEGTKLNANKMRGTCTEKKGSACLSTREKVKNH